MSVRQPFASVLLGPVLLLLVLFAGLTPLAVAVGQALPPAGMLAFSVATRTQAEWQIMLLDMRTRAVHPVARYGWRVPLVLEWSPDGTRIAYATIGMPSDIHIFDYRTLRTTNITRSAADDRHPIWSADGTRLLFYSKTGSDFEIHTIAPDGGSLTRLTTHEGVLPAFSPDGTQIVFTSTREHNLFLMNADGSGLQRITDEPSHHRRAVWSPDGSQLAFVDHIRGETQFIYTMATACMGTGDCPAVLAYPGFRFQGMPHWSPDGRYVAFVGQMPQDESDSIYLLDVQPGHQPRRLVSDVFYTYSEQWAMWSPDSRALVYASRSRPGLFMVDVVSGQVEQLSSLPARYPVWRP